MLGECLTAASTAPLARKEAPIAWRGGLRAGRFSRGVGADEAGKLRRGDARPHAVRLEAAITVWTCRCRRLWRGAFTSAWSRNARSRRYSGMSEACFGLDLPELTAAVSRWWSRSFCSAYACENSRIAR